MLVVAPVIARIEVNRVSSKRPGVFITCRTTCRLADDGMLAVDGEATVLIPHSST